MKLRSQFFSRDIGAYRLAEPDMVITSEPKTYSDSDGFAKEFSIADIAETFRVSSHVGRWAQSDLEDFADSGRVPDPVHLATKIRDLLNSFVVFPKPEQAALVALWIMATYMFELFNAFPYLHLFGPAGSGKTKLLSVLSQLVYNPVFTGNISLAAMFRVVEATAGTVLLDEAEILGTDFGVEHKLLLNGGYKKGACVYRMEQGEGGRFGIREFNIFSPKALGSINALPGTLGSRCIQIQTLPAKGHASSKLVDLESTSFQA